MQEHHLIKVKIGYRDNLVIASFHNIRIDCEFRC